MKWIFIFMICFLVFSCRKNQNNSFICDSDYIAFYLPDSINNNWFNHIIDSGLGGKNFEGKSSNGLSETFSVRSGIRWHQVNACMDYLVYNKQFYYVSTLYNNSFIVSMGYRTNRFPTDFLLHGNNIYVDTNMFELVIHSTAVNNNNEINYIDLKQQISPIYSEKIKAILYNSRKNVIDSFMCDTCLQWKGNYVQDSITYNQVYKYINPFVFDNSIKEFLIDKNYGVFNFTKGNNNNWKINPFK